MSFVWVLLAVGLAAMLGWIFGRMLGYDEGFDAGRSVGRIGAFNEMSQKAARKLLEESREGS